MDGRKTVLLFDGHFHDSEIVFRVNQTKLTGSTTPPLLLYFYFYLLYLYIYLFIYFHREPLSSVKMRPAVLFAVGPGWSWQPAVSVFYVPLVSVCIWLQRPFFSAGPFAPGLYLLLSLTVMKPAFKERGAGGEASQIRSVKRLAGWAWWMRARMSFCRGCIVKSFHCHRRAYEGLMNEGASVRNTLPLLPLPPL